MNEHKFKLQCQKKLMIISLPGIISRTIYELIYHSVAFILYIIASILLLLKVKDHRLGDSNWNMIAAVRKNLIMTVVKNSKNCNGLKLLFEFEFFVTEICVKSLKQYSSNLFLNFNLDFGNNSRSFVLH